MNMKIVKISTTLLFAVSLIFAEMSISTMDETAMGISYNPRMFGFELETAGQKISTSQHIFGFGYSPIDFALFTIDVGLGKVYAKTTDTADFYGDFGFSGGGSVLFYSPTFAKVLSVTGGGRINWILSEEGGEEVSLLTVNPSIGLIITPMRIMSFELGASYRYGNGSSIEIAGLDDSFDASIPILGYIEFLLNHPRNGAFFLVKGELTPDISSDSHGVYDGAIMLSIGTVLRHNKRPAFADE